MGFKIVSPLRTAGRLGLLFCVAAGACRQSEQAGRNGDEVTEGRWKAGQEWRLVPEVRIGSGDGDEAYTFSMVVGLVLDDMNRVWVADRLEQNIRVFDSRGTHVRTIGRKGSGPGEFLPVTASDRRRVLGYYEDFIKKGGRIDESRIPKTQPALNSFFFDDEGRLWVQPSYAAGEPPVLDVFEPTGRYLGQVQVPPRFAVGPGPVVRGNRMVAVTTDEDAVPSVVVLRIEKPAA